MGDFIKDEQFPEILEFLKILILVEKLKNTVS
jgi:hypothetical protein